jgi:Putative transposase of IS4/5 family (DUF4096)
MVSPDSLAQRARCQAETPLIALFRFPTPALIPPNKPGGNKRSVNVRQVMNGIMYILSTGCQWRAIPPCLNSSHAPKTI